MYLYRAINSFDEKIYNKKNFIVCNLYRTNNIFDEKNYSEKNCIAHNILSDNELKYIKIKNEVFSGGIGDIGLILDRIIGHVNGKNLKNSCWVSTSSDLLLTISEFAIPQSGKYNIDPERKNVIVIDIDDSNEILPSTYSRDDKDIKKITGKYIDLSSGKLQKYVAEGFIRPLSANERSYFERPTYSVNYNPQTINVAGFSNFAESVSEHLFYFGIENIKYILSPLEQDLIYAIQNEFPNIELKYIVDYVKTNPLNIDTKLLDGVEVNIYNYLYKPINNKYNNLIDLVPILFEENQSFYDIIYLYEFLKNKKRSLMKKLLQQLYCINVTKSISLPDDKIYTTTDYYYNNNMVNSNKQKTSSNKNDIIYIQDSNNVVKRLIL